MPKIQLQIRASEVGKRERSGPRLAPRPIVVRTLPDGHGGSGARAGGGAANAGSVRGSQMASSTVVADAAITSACWG